MAEIPEVVGLASAIEALRAELETALTSGQGRSVRFTASTITLKLQATARHEKDGSGKIRWWIIEGGVGAKATDAVTQTLELTLIPMLHREDGRDTPLNVADAQSRPGE